MKPTIPRNKQVVTRSELDWIIASAEKGNSRATALIYNLFRRGDIKASRAIRGYWEKKYHEDKLNTKLLEKAQKESFTDPENSWYIRELLCDKNHVPSLRAQATECCPFGLCGLSRKEERELTKQHLGYLDKAASAGHISSIEDAIEVCDDDPSLYDKAAQYESMLDDAQKLATIMEELEAKIAALDAIS